jgi:hypothetical protein
MITLAAADYLAADSTVGSVVTYTIEGMELNGSTEIYKLLAQGQVGATIGTIYTAPTSTTAFIKRMSFVNNDTQMRTLELTRGGTAAANRIAPILEIPAGGMAEYEDGKGWQMINAQGQMLVSQGINPSWYNNQKVLTGAQYETIDRNMCDEVNTAVLSTGRMSLQAIWLPAGVTINSISFWSATTAGATLTNQLFGLYDLNLNLLRSSASDGATAWAANSRKTLALTAPFTTTYTGLHYLAIMVAATTVPTLKGNTAKVGGQLNAGAPSMGGTSNTGLSTTLPATANAPGTVTTSFWGCVN